MRRFVEGIDRGQATLFPECLADWIDETNPVRVIDAFVDKLDLSRLGFEGVAPEATGRPSYHPAVLLKLYIYGYLNRVFLLALGFRTFSHSLGAKRTFDEAEKCQ
jgi:transposase